MKLKYIFYGVAASLALTACGDMDFHEYKVDDENYIKENFGNVYGLMTTVYRDLDYDFGNMYNGASLCSATDEAVYSHIGNQIESFYNGAWGPANANASVWNTCWDGISYCNLILDKFTGLTFDDYKLDVNYKAEMEKYENFKWECRFLRAYFYFQLVRQYGGVPLKTEHLDAQTANNLERASADDIFKFIDDECVAIKDNIIADYSTAYSELGLPETGRANNLAVLALRARAALYHASPLFTEGKSADEVKQLWYEAASAAKDCMNECANRGRALDKYENGFDVNNYKNSKELLFGTRTAAANSFEKYNFPIGMENAGGGNCPSENLVSAYETIDGSPVDPQNPYANRDLRLGITVAVNGERWPDGLDNSVLETYYGGANGRNVSYGTPTGYYLKKYVSRTQVIGATSPTTSYHTWVIFRLGEIYLDYAEAVLNYFGNGYTTDSKFTMSAADAINRIRTRAGITALPAGLDFETFKARYENERFVELAFEGHRFYDVRRWKLGSKYFKDIKVMEIEKVGDDFKYKVVTNPPYITARQWDERMNLSPIPQSEILKSGNLTQNPGW